MGGFAMKEALRLMGALLLILAGAGGGMAVYRHKYSCWRQLHTFSRFLQYLEETLTYQALTGTQLLRRAERYPEFAQIGLTRCRELTDVPLPASMPVPLRQELQSSLEQLAFEPRESACSTLQRMALLCESAAAEKQSEAIAARKLWPRLGACFGFFAAILLW